MVKLFIAKFLNVLEKFLVIIKNSQVSVIEENAKIYLNSEIIGGIKLGKKFIISALSFVNKNICKNLVAVALKNSNYEIAYK